MEEIKHLQRVEFDGVMKCGRDMILFFYNKEGDAASTLGIQTMNDVNALVGRDFDLYFVDASAEPDILRAFSVKSVPEYVSMKQCRIYKRSTDLLYANQVLSLLK